MHSIFFLPDIYLKLPAGVGNSQIISFCFCFCFLMTWCIILSIILISIKFSSMPRGRMTNKAYLYAVLQTEKEYSPCVESCRSVRITLLWLCKCQILEAFNAPLSLLNSVLWDSRYSPDFCCCFDKMCKMHFMTKPMYVLDCFTDQCLRELNQERFYMV